MSMPLSERLRPYKHALFRFVAMRWLQWRQLRHPHGTPGVRRVATSTFEYVRHLAPREPGEAYRAVETITSTAPPPAKTLGTSRLTAKADAAAREMFVARLDNVRVLGETGHVVTRDGTLLADVSFQFPATCYADSAWAELDGPYESARQLSGTACLMTSKWAGVNYFHFLFELLPRREMIRRSGMEPETIDHFIVNPPLESHLPSAVYWEGLERCGIVREKAVGCEANSAFQVSHLIAPSTLHGTAHLRPWVCEWLNQTFARETRTGRRRVRLYVGRDNAHTRRLTNQAEILAMVLLPRGFETVRWEGHSIRQQAALYANADVVVGVNGAALTNLVFCAPGTRVIVLHYPTYISRYFYELCYTRGLDYYYLVGETTTPLKPGEYNRDYAVNPAALAELLEIAGVN